MIVKELINELSVLNQDMSIYIHKDLFPIDKPFNMNGCIKIEIDKEEKQVIIRSKEDC